VLPVAWCRAPGAWIRPVPEPGGDLGAFSPVLSALPMSFYCFWKYSSCFLLVVLLSNTQQGCLALSRECYKEGKKGQAEDME